MKIDMQKQLVAQARTHRDMGDPLTIEELASVAADIQRQNIETLSQKPSNFVERLDLEKLQLHGRMVSLEKFIDSDPFFSLEAREQGLLRDQLTAMKKYYGALNQRCYRHSVGKWHDED